MGDELKWLLKQGERGRIFESCDSSLSQKNKQTNKQTNKKAQLTHS